MGASIFFVLYDAFLYLPPADHFIFHNVHHDHHCQQEHGLRTGVAHTGLLEGAVVNAHDQGDRRLAVRDPQQLRPGDEIETRVEKGSFHSTVTS